MKLSEYKFLQGWSWGDYTTLQGCCDAEGYVYINYLIQGLVHDGCHSGHRKVTCRHPVTGSMTNQEHPLLRSRIHQSTGNEAMCRLLLANDWMHQGRVRKVHSWKTGASSAWLLCLKDTLMALALLSLHYAAGLSRTLPRNLASFSFTCTVVWRPSRPFLTPSSCSLTDVSPNKILASWCLLLENSHEHKCSLIIVVSKIMFITYLCKPLSWTYDGKMNKHISLF